MTYNNTLPNLFISEVFKKPYTSLLLNNYDKIIANQCGIYPFETLHSLFNNAWLPVMKKIWEKIFIVELNMAAEDGLLLGETNEAKFDYFCSNVVNDIEDIYRKYPELKSQWEKEKILYTNSLIIMLDNIKSDINNAVGYLFRNKHVQFIQEITLAGDPHKGMQQTAKVTIKFADNTSDSIFYKPRNLTIDKEFYHFIKWWNEQSIIDHKVPKVYQNREFGWVENINNTPCRNNGEITNFYVRYGSLVALLYSFATTDIHMENLIASSGYPVIVDLETLFSCRLNTQDKLPLSHHLYWSLLLPSNTMINGIEISPLTAKGDVEINKEFLFNPNKKVVDLKLEKRNIVTQKHQNEVIYDESIINFINYKEEVITGFINTYKFILNNKEKFSQVVLEMFSNSTEVRIIVRNTGDYVHTLHNIYHPEILLNSSVQSEIYLMLENDIDNSIIHSEIKELTNGDVPYFYTQFNSHDLLNGAQEILDNILTLSPKQKLLKQIEGISHEDLGQKIKDIQYSFLAHRLRNGDINKSYSRKVRNKSQKKDSIKDITIFSLDWMLDNMVNDNRYIYWRDINFTDNNETTASFSDCSLYSGLSGIALVLNRIGIAYKKGIYCRVASDIQSVLYKQIITCSTFPLGAYSFAYAIITLSELSKNNLINIYPCVVDAVEKIAASITLSTYHEYSSLDLVSGLSGTIVLLIRLHKIYFQYPIGKQIQTLLSNAFRILIHQCVTVDFNEKLIGYAHGSSGVSAAIAAYMSYFSSNEPEARKIIQNNVIRENEYRNKHGWDDIRDNKNEKNTSWCHGTIGFGFSRLHIKPFISDNQFNNDMEIVNNRLGEERLSLAPCHGMAGDLAFLQMQQQTLEINNGKKYNEILKSITHIIVKNGVRLDYGLNNYELIGYMNGVSGLIDLLNKSAILI